MSVENQPIKKEKKQQAVNLSITEIQSWLVSYLANLLGIDSDEVDVTIPFERYGLDSEAAIVMSGDLQEWLGYNLEPTLLFDYPTVADLGQYLGDILHH